MNIAAVRAAVEELSTSSYANAFTGVDNWSSHHYCDSYPEYLYNVGCTTFTQTSFKTFESTMQVSFFYILCAKITDSIRLFTIFTVCQVLFQRQLYLFCDPFVTCGVVFTSVLTALSLLFTTPSMCRYWTTTLLLKLYLCTLVKFRTL